MQDLDCFYHRPLLAQATKPAPLNIPFNSVVTPSFLTDEALLEDNLRLLATVQARTGCRIILAQKAFSFYPAYPLIRRHLAGTAASGLYEARLGREEMGGEVHVYSPAYRAEEVRALLPLVNYLIFNSFNQWLCFRAEIAAYNRQTDKPVSVGLRINPEYSEVDTEIYNPAARHSRLGITADHFFAGVKAHGLAGIDGLHFHTLCEENADALANTLAIIHDRFGSVLKQMKWFNLGGGHHITRADYDLALLEQCIRETQARYPGIQVYLEPGEAIPLDCGWLVTEVLDLTENEMHLAQLDTSGVCHMPDVIEMPYRPKVFAVPPADQMTDTAAYVLAGEPGEYPYTYRLGGPTCLAGDIIGDYAFPEPLQIGQRLVFCDMALYTMVKTNTFNGMPLPTLLYRRLDGSVETCRTFGYEDFKMRLGHWPAQQEQTDA